MSKNLKLSILSAAFIMLAAFSALAQNVARAEAVKAGDVAPDFTLSDNSGKPITLSEAVKNAPVVLVFYRGYW